LKPRARLKIWVYRCKSPANGAATDEWPTPARLRAGVGVIVAWEALRTQRDASIDPATVAQVKAAEQKAVAPTLRTSGQTMIRVLALSRSRALALSRHCEP